MSSKHRNKVRILTFDSIALGSVLWPVLYDNGKWH